MTDSIIKIKNIRGKLIREAVLAPYTWLRVGGTADWLFIPKDIEDLSSFLRQLPARIPVLVLGVGSNILIRDGGLKGVVIRLGPSFSDIKIVNHHSVRVGAACLDSRLARVTAEKGYAGLEFFSGIPGTLGGALRMNAGCYGSETKDVFLDALALDRQGNKVSLSASDMAFSYRNSIPPEGLIFVEAGFKIMPEDKGIVLERIKEISKKRQETQPIGEKTGGSTFKNPLMPETRKAWQLIDYIGGRGRKYREAMFSHQHCNFLINQGQARASDMETLAESVRWEVLEQTGVDLQWEIKRFGYKTLEEKNKLPSEELMIWNETL